MFGVQACPGIYLTSCGLSDKCKEQREPVPPQAKAVLLTDLAYCLEARSITGIELFLALQPLCFPESKQAAMISPLRLRFRHLRW